MCDFTAKDYSHHFAPDDVNEMLSNRLTDESVDSKVGVVKSSNCVINIEYIVQDEKIVFEVFKSTVDSNCVLKRDIALVKSNDPNDDIKDLISSFNNVPFDTMKVNNTSQTEPVDFLMTEPKKRTKSPNNKKVAFECPEKDTSESVIYVPYKEIYPVSSFKFAEPKPAALNTTINDFCALEFDGTRSRKHRHSAKSTRTKTTNLKRVKSDTNIMRTAKNLLKQKTENHITEKLKKSVPTSNKEIEEKSKKHANKKRHSSTESRHKKQSGESDSPPECVRSDRAQFEIVLTPRKLQNRYGDKLKSDTKTETITLGRQKPRKIILKSNTLELLTKPEMKSVALQTTLSSFVEKSVLLKDLYAMPYFNSSLKSLKSMHSGDGNMEEINLQQEQPINVSEQLKPGSFDEDARKSRRCNLTKTLNPCYEIKNGPENPELPPPKTRPTIPRRRLDANETNIIGNINLEDMKTSQIPFNVPNTHTHIPRIIRDDNGKNESHLIDDNFVVKDLSMLRTHISNWLTNSKQQKNVNAEEYDKEIDDLCSAITSLLHNNPNEQTAVLKCTKKQECLDKPSINDWKSPREKFGTVKDVVDRNAPLKKTVTKPTMIDLQQNKSPRLKICLNQENNVTINNEDTVQLEQDKIVKNNEPKTVAQNAFRREMSNLSSKAAESNKYHLKKQKPNIKYEEHISNKNFDLSIESMLPRTVNRRLRPAIKNQMSEDENITDKIVQRNPEQNDGNTNNQMGVISPKKGMFSKRYANSNLNARVFEQCLSSKKRKSAVLSCSTATLNSQADERQTVTSNTQKKKTTIPVRSRTFSEIQRANKTPTKPALMKRDPKYLSKSSLNTYTSRTSQGASLQQSKSELFNSDNMEDFKAKVKYSGFEKNRLQNPGSIHNSTFLFTKVNMDNNANSCFKKRKEYALKLKKREQNEDLNQINNNNSPQSKIKQQNTSPRIAWNPNFSYQAKNMNNFLHKPQYKHVFNAFEPREEANNSLNKIVHNDTELATDKKKKSFLFPYHFEPEDVVNSENKSVSQNDSHATNNFLNDFPLVENSQQVYIASNVQNAKEKSSSNKNARQSKPKNSISKSAKKADKPRPHSKRVLLRNKTQKSSRNSSLNKYSDNKNTSHGKQSEMGKAVLGEIKTVCCSLCCKTKPNVDSDSTFKNNAANTTNSTDHAQSMNHRPSIADGNSPTGILKNGRKIDGNAVEQKKTVNIDDSPKKKDKGDHNGNNEDGNVLCPKVSYEYWRCSVVENQPLDDKEFDSHGEKEEKQKNVEEKDSNEKYESIDDEMTFYSSQSIAVDKSAASNLQELKLSDTSTDSFKSLPNINEETITVLLDNCNTNKAIHRTDSDAESELGLVCTLKQNKTGDCDTLEFEKLLTRKKSKLLNHINKFFGKKNTKKL